MYIVQKDNYISFSFQVFYFEMTKCEPQALLKGNSKELGQEGVPPPKPESGIRRAVLLPSSASLLSTWTSPPPTVTHGVYLPHSCAGGSTILHKLIPVFDS